MVMSVFSATRGEGDTISTRTTDTAVQHHKRHFPTNPLVLYIHYGIYYFIYTFYAFAE